MKRVFIKKKSVKIALKPVIAAFVISINLSFFLSNLFAAHPLITDDTGTQGKGNIQIELNGEYAKDEENGEKENTSETAVSFTYGVIDTLDMVLGLPYQYNQTETSSETTKEKGISDASFDLKWRFFNISKFSFAVKPGISIPTGDYKKGTGSGKAGYSGHFITTMNFEPFLLHLNLGYIRNENKIDERKDIWHTSLACEYIIVKDLKIVANIGAERNPDPESSINPAFLLGGLIYSINDSLDIDAGYKYGLNSSEVDHSILAGLTKRF